MKFLIGLMTAILITGIASAQHGNSPAGKINLGVKGGIGVFNIYNDNGVKYDSRIGYNIGLFGHIHFNSQFAFQPEIVYSAQGAKSGRATYNLDYINIPLLFQYMYDNGFRLQAGPQVGFLASSNMDDIKPVDFALSVGASYVVPETGFGIVARYNLGLANINKSGTVKSTNRGFQFGLFYIFGHNSRIVLN
ncbi:MAG: PorT family protein [Bacteroidales bacterium]|nr:PorT family protein [Bacteroidales bacterium]